jgi:hypothetical protein
LTIPPAANAYVATMVGALTLARAVDDPELSDRIGGPASDRRSVSRRDPAQLHGRRPGGHRITWRDIRGQQNRRIRTRTIASACVFQAAHSRRGGSPSGARMDFAG